MSFVEVRRARPEDLSRLVELCALHAAYEGGNACAVDLSARLGQALFSECPRAMGWVAETQSVSGAAGFATASPVFSTWHGEDFLHLDCLYLVESARGLGAGRMLVEAARAFALSAGFRWLEWQTPAWNAPAIRFYERLGATATTKQRFTLLSAVPAT